MSIKPKCTCKTHGCAYFSSRKCKLTGYKVKCVFPPNAHYHYACCPRWISEHEAYEQNVKEYSDYCINKVAKKRFIRNPRDFDWYEDTKNGTEVHISEIPELLDKEVS